MFQNSYLHVLLNIKSILVQDVYLYVFLHYHQLCTVVQHKNEHELLNIKINFTLVQDVYLYVFLLYHQLCTMVQYKNLHVLLNIKVNLVQVVYL